QWTAPVTGSGGAPDAARLTASFTRDPAGAGPMTAGVQYYLFDAMFDGSHAYDDGATSPVCAGCTTPGCFVFRQVTLHQPPPMGAGGATWANCVGVLATWAGAVG